MFSSLKHLIDLKSLWLLSRSRFHWHTKIQVWQGRISVFTLGENWYSPLSYLYKPRGMQNTYCQKQAGCSVSILISKIEIYQGLCQGHSRCSITYELWLQLFCLKKLKLVQDVTLLDYLCKKYLKFCRYQNIGTL